MRNPFPINAQTHEYCGPNRFEEREKREEQFGVMAERVEQYLAGDLDWKELVRRAALLHVDDATLNRMVRFQQELKEAKTSPAESDPRIRHKTWRVTVDDNNSSFGIETYMGDQVVTGLSHYIATKLVSTHNETL